MVGIAIGPHAARIGTLIVFKRPFMILHRHHVHHGFAIDKTHQTKLLTYKLFLHHHAPGLPRRGGGLGNAFPRVHHALSHIFQMIPNHLDPFAAFQSIRLHHKLSAQCLRHVRLKLILIAALKHPKLGVAGDIVFFKKIASERFGRFQPRETLNGGDTRHTQFRQRIDHARGNRRLGPGHHKVRLDFFYKLPHRVKVRHRGHFVLGRQAR